MDVWGSQPLTGATGAAGDEEEEWEVADKGKDALIVLVDARKAMFAPYPHATDEANAPATWFHAILDLLVKLMKSKVVASDNSLLSVVFFGSGKRAETNTLEGIYELQSLGYPSAQRIKELQALLESGHDLQSEFQSLDNTDKLAFSNALWHCGISFSSANLKKKDSQRVWIFTNDDSCVVPDSDEVGRIQKQVQNHVELKRTLNLFYITPPDKDAFELSKFYSCVFKDFSADDDETMSMTDDALLQPAFPVSSLEDLMEGSLRKRFRKRRLTTFPLHITKDVSIGVELYALAVVQRKTYPVSLDASTNTPLKSETKWLCDDTGSYLTPDQIKKYIAYGGKRVYFSRDDVVQIKYYDAPGLQLICFKPLSSLNWNDNIRAPYFVYPCDGYIEGSSTAFLALLNSMVKREKYALARLIARKTSEPRLVALVPQEEAYDELGQVQPSGFHVVFLPYLDDVRDVQVDAPESAASDDQVTAAKELISKLKLAELPSFENPELQKHYASVQALALGEEQLEFDESKDTTLPDAEGFTQDEVKEAIERFKDVCGGDAIETPNLKRKSKAPAAKKTPKKKTARAGEDDDDQPVAGESFDKTEWAQLVATNAIQKKTIPELKEFLHAYGQPVSGRKGDLIDRVHEVLDS
ncbi:hypothetical protein Poli38472_004255 [Pythium oligandrum]|uniref:SAP domain-containing protein n=1 Tax=Pythium oligandrum TaxID=41045 RepID=A0A8K1CNB2_PYTOL|nr:hypothetical protein Poli38472_004255 [Pythium oligandrum]|eukprot:TMW66490.1 hypothetical protein Poli38472_004255 [Pythium oligandrum]